MTEWPKDDTKTLHFEALTTPIREAIKAAYRIRRKSIGKAIPWTGPSEIPAVAVCSLDPIFHLSVRGLEWNKEHGRSPIDAIVSIAVQLGIEQGRRIERAERKPEEEIRRLLDGAGKEN